MYYVAHTQPMLFGLLIRASKPRFCVSNVPNSLRYRFRGVLHEKRPGSVIGYVFAVAFTFLLCAPALANDDWKEVDERRALLEFKDATCTRVLQRKDGETTLEQSYWMLSNGADVFFHVTRLGPRWVLTDRGPTLEEVFRRAFPTAELEEIGEPFHNRDGGTQGRAQWLRYRHLENHCVLMRQYGGVGVSARGAAIALGSRVAVGTYCANLKLSRAEIGQLFKRIDF